MASYMSDDSGHQGFSSGGSMFHEASDVHIHNGTFNAYGSVEMDAEKTRIEEAMELLSSLAEHGAPYDAAAREDVPKCHEHTRVAIINSIHKWARAQGPDSPALMWMYGPAGSGKTTIMQTIADTFDQEERLAASFFFSRLSAARPTEKKNFVITIAYQLSLCVPALQKHLANALSDSSIFTKSLAKQLDALVIGPLKMLDPAQVESRCIFLIDGLDECSEDAAQKDVLDLLEQFLRQAPFRVRILVASRALSHIQAFFSLASIRSNTQTIALDNNYKPDKDIMTFLIAEFGKIQNGHPACNGLAAHWPPSSDLDTLVGRASGQFIYASVVMKYIADHSRHPGDSLQTIISLKSSGTERPYDQLDAVYGQVLSTIEPQNVAYVQIIMGCLLMSTDFRIAGAVQEAHIKAVDFLFMARPGTTDARIHRIYPLIDRGPKRGMRFSHASFPEYLVDLSRSGEFFLDICKIHCDLARHWFKLHHARFQLHQLAPCTKKMTIHACICSVIFYPNEVADFQEMLLHCYAAEWTPELQQDILSYNFCAGLLNESRSTDPKDKVLYWIKIIRWLNFAFWAERNCFLSSADADKIRVSIASVISTDMTQDPPATISKKAIAAFLIKPSYFKIWQATECALDPKGQYTSLISYPHYPHYCDGGQELDSASQMWLVKTLAPDLVVNGLYIGDEDLNQEMALQMAPKSLEYWHCYKNLPMILSKASPSPELAAVLGGLLHIPKTCVLLDGKATKPISEPLASQLFTAICLYLHECQVPFISNHQHKSDFNHDEWYCGICLLFSPLTGQCAGLEFSLDPPATSSPGPLNKVLQIIALHYPIPRLPLLQIWIFWIADMIIHFLPVVA